MLVRKKFAITLSVLSIVIVLLFLYISRAPADIILCGLDPGEEVWLISYPPSGVMPEKIKEFADKHGVASFYNINAEASNWWIMERHDPAKGGGWVNHSKFKDWELNYRGGKPVSVNCP